MADLFNTGTEKRHFLVSGGLGFIGIHLCQSLLNRYAHCQLSIVDNLSSTKTDYSSLEPHADIHITDFRDYKPPTRGITDVFHLASPVGSLGILEKHGHIASDILELAHCASDIAASHGARLLYLSSSEVYGRDGEHSEDAQQIVPARYGSRMEYALGKLTAEHVLTNLADAGSHQLRIVRPFNVVGPWQDERLGFVVPHFFKAALTGNALTVHDNGMQTRSFCDVRDLVAGLLAIHEKGTPSATYNVGNPNNRTTIKALAEEIVRVCDSDSPIQHIDPRTRYGGRYLEAYNKMPVIKRAIKDTGWQPMHALDDILKNLKTFYIDQNATVVFKSAPAAANRDEPANA